MIDVHSHIITPEFVSALETEGRVLDEGFPLPKWDAEAQLKWMDEAGIQMSVLTLAAPQSGLTPDPSPKGEGSEYIKGGETVAELSAPLSTRRGAGGEALCRLAEIEVYPEYLTEYLTFANEVDRLSVEREPGVVCLFPMQSTENSTKIRILEIYASDEAYQQHLKTDHFLRYKQGTLHMVKSLRLPTMQPLDPEAMKLIFKKQR